MQDEVDRFFEQLDRDAIVAAIKEAEDKGRGEIRVHLQRGRVKDAMGEASRVFKELGMEKTEQRSGCLIFIAPEEKAFAVVGDLGIHEKVGDAFWLNARDAAAEHFSQGRFTDGVVAAVRVIGEALARYFPREAVNPNELPDDVSVN